MKTAMQELILKLPNEFIFDNPNIILEALEKEKEQIIDAYEDGKQNGMDSITNVHMYIIGEKYYNQTYNQNK